MGDMTSEILRSIADSYSVALDQLESNESSENLSEAIRRQLGLLVTPLEVRLSYSLLALSTLVESRLDKNRSGKTLLDIYLEVEKLAKDEYHSKIPFEWCAKWNDFLKVGNWFTRPDGLDAVEIVIRMEDRYGIKISDEDAAAMETVGQTIRYLWEKT